MTLDEIIRMAREAGFPFTKYGALECDEDGEIDADEMFEHFAALVAAAEREACAKIVDVYDYARFSEECAKAIRARGEKGKQA